MTEDRFMERLRSDAEQLRYTPADNAPVWTRLSAGIRSRMQPDATVSGMLARWFRPIIASFAMLAIVAALSISWIETREPAYNSDSLASNSMEISIDGDTYSLAE
jgi:hypothetical protein